MEEEIGNQTRKLEGSVTPRQSCGGGGSGGPQGAARERRGSPQVAATACMAHPRSKGLIRAPEVERWPQSSERRRAIREIRPRVKGGERGGRG